MARGNEVDVMAAGRLQPKHDVSEFLSGDLAPFAAPADFPVLAIDATHIAERKKDRARSTRAAKAIFLTVMRAGRTDDRPFAGAADRATCGCNPVDMTVTGTQIAVL